MGEVKHEPAANNLATPLDNVLRALQERAKELRSLYAIDEILHTQEKPFDELLRLTAEAIPSGWQYPQFCMARITFQGRTFSRPGFTETPWGQSAPIYVQEGVQAGTVGVFYTQELPEADEGPFLKEERKLIETIASRIGQAAFQRDLKSGFDQRAEASSAAGGRRDWRIILDLLKTTDLNLFKQLSRKMLNHLSCNGISEAKELLRTLSASRGDQDEIANDENRPLQKTEAKDLDTITEETFIIASHHLSEQELLSLIQVWIKEDRVNFLVQALEAADTSLVEIASAMQRYHHTGVSARELSIATQVGLKTSLVRRLLTDSLDFIDTSRKHVEVEDFFEILDHTILVPKSHGKLGGKTSGLFLASRIIRGAKEYSDLLANIRIPKTWYIPSDLLLHFLAHNNLDDVYNWKYLDIDQIREEYPHILQVFKSSRFPPDVVQGISIALDDFGDHPLIVRSSSLLEDRMGSAFSGKYKSLFLANQGDKPSRLAALLDALAEVYASIFGPDPIQYRAERGLLDQHEEMGIMIQQVVGTRVGHYFFPAFSGVGFSNNEFRWSPRIKREDGLLRLVPGLGTRAVDRTDDYPMLVAPGQPNLRVNVTPEETVRYAPKKIDVINLEKNEFQTLEIRRLLSEIGPQYPAVGQLISVFEDDRIRTPIAINVDFERDDVVFTFENLITKTPFIAQMRNLLSLLRNTLRTPVDIEFACDGRNFYLLQCRPQSYTQESIPTPIPRDIPESQIVFSASRHVSNGKTPDLTHIVYVDPDGYGRLRSLADLQAVGRAVSHLNKILPRRRFLLMGPGRWGSRGDIKLGVSVTYSDINNTAVLIEIARKTGNYVPDLSFGTHFFQDLVESSIRYLPLYPDDPGIIFQEAFLKNSHNLLPELLPEYASLAHTVHVIDVPRATGGRILRVLMNADLDEAVGILVPAGELEIAQPLHAADAASHASDDSSRWRCRMAQRITATMDAERFGVRGVYLVGSTKNGTAGPDADIDLIIHFEGTQAMKRDLEFWLEGWSLALAEINFLKTGYKQKGLLDVRIITGEEIASQTGFGAKIGAVTDPARCLTLGPR